MAQIDDQVVFQAFLYTENYLNSVTSEDFFVFLEIRLDFFRRFFLSFPENLKGNEL